MRTEVKDVFSARNKDGSTRADKQRVLVGKASFPIYDTVEEARNALSDTKLLELVNTQVQTNELNRVRAEAVGGVSESSLRMEALLRLSATPEGLQKLASASQDKVRMETVIAEAIATLKVEKGIPVAPTDEAEST